MRVFVGRASDADAAVVEGAEEEPRGVWRCGQLQVNFFQERKRAHRTLVTCLLVSIEDHGLVVRRLVGRNQRKVDLHVAPCWAMHLRAGSPAAAAGMQQQPTKYSYSVRWGSPLYQCRSSYIPTHGWFNKRRYLRMASQPCARVLQQSAVSSMSAYIIDIRFHHHRQGFPSRCRT